MTCKMQKKTVLLAWFMKICATHRGLILTFKKLVLTMPTHCQLISI